MSKYAVLITSTTASPEWYTLDAPNRKQAQQAAQRLAKTDFAGDDDVVVVVDSITYPKKCNIDNARESFCMELCYLKRCKDFGEEFRQLVHAERQLKEIHLMILGIEQ